MQRLLATCFFASTCVLMSACGRQPSASSGHAAMAMAPVPPAAALAAAPQRAGTNVQPSMLAYEHEVELQLAADRIPDRLRRAQTACRTARFGDCVVLDVTQRGGDTPGGSLAMRIAPAGVEPMIKLAGEGAQLGSRMTQAEDLAVAVRDNDLAQSRLRSESARLQEFSQRRDLAVADMIALSAQMAQTDSQLQAAEQEAAQQHRRIDTQLLTVRFEPSGNETGRGEVGQALRDFGSVVSTGTAWSIRALAFLLPAGLMAWVLFLLIRRLRRVAKTRPGIAP